MIDYLGPGMYQTLRATLDVGGDGHAIQETGRTPEAHEAAVLAHRDRIDAARARGWLALTVENAPDTAVGGERLSPATTWKNLRIAYEATR